ncbi:MAG: hypothetical protein ABIQ30_13010 [Devosia sp.]
MVAGLLGSLLLGGAAQAKRNTVEQQAQHYLECLDWMINDPAKHAEFCGPGFEWFAPDAAKNPVDNLPHPPVVVPPVVVPPTITPPIVTPTCETDASLCQPAPCPAAYVQNVGLLLTGGDGHNYDPCNPPQHHNPCEGTYNSAYYVDASYGGDCDGHHFDPCADKAAYVLTGGMGGMGGSKCGETHDPCPMGSLDTPMSGIVAVKQQQQQQQQQQQHYNPPQHTNPPPPRSNCDAGYDLELPLAGGDWNLTAI